MDRQVAADGRRHRVRALRRAGRGARSAAYAGLVPDPTQSDERAQPRIRLLGKPGCHLCDDARAVTTRRWVTSDSA